MDNSITKRLRDMRKSQGWLSRKTNINRPYINRLCNKKILNPRIETAFKIARAMKCLIEDIFSMNEK